METSELRSQLDRIGSLSSHLNKIAEEVIRVRITNAELSPSAWFRCEVGRGFVEFAHGLIFAFQHCLALILLSILQICQHGVFRKRDGVLP
jgi:hypothetical protein